MKVDKIRFDQQLAQVICDDSEDALAIMLRDKEKQALKLVYLDLKNGETWEIAEGLNWWYQLKACSKGKLILNGFEDPGLPMTKGIYVFEARSGQKIWERSSSNFLYQTLEGIWVEEGEQKVFLSIEDGNSIQPPLETAHQKYSQNFNSAYKACRVVYQLDDEFPSLQHKINTLWEHKVEEYLDHLVFEGKEIFSYPHRNPTGGWDQELAIVKDGELILKRKTGTRLKGIAWSTFFIWRKFLIWQEDYQSLCFSFLG